MMVRPAQSRTREQAAYLDQLIQSDETIAVMFRLAQDFGHLLRKREGQVRLEQWKAAVLAACRREAGASCQEWYTCGHEETIQNSGLRPGT